MSGVLTREDLLAAIETIRNEPARPWRFPPMSKAQFEVFKDTDIGLYYVYGFDVDRGVIRHGWAY